MGKSEVSGYYLCTSHEKGMWNMSENRSTDLNNVHILFIYFVSILPSSL